LCRNEFSSRVHDFHFQFATAFNAADYQALNATVSCLQRVRPILTRLFVDKWDNTEESWSRYVETADQLSSFLTRDLTLDTLTAPCRDEGCLCPLSLGPIGDRGGPSRRTPCQRCDFKSSPTFEILVFKQVSIKCTSFPTEKWVHFQNFPCHFAPGRWNR
jgi:hypothetical protein